MDKELLFKIIIWLIFYLAFPLLWLFFVKKYGYIAFVIGFIITLVVILIINVVVAVKRKGNW